MITNKKHCLVWFVFIFSILVFACNPTEVSAQSSSNEQRLVGTWTDLINSNNTVVFNANGTISSGYLFQHWSNVPTHWVAVGNTILLYTPNQRNDGTYSFEISGDGRTLRFDGKWFRKN